MASSTYNYVASWVWSTKSAAEKKQEIEEEIDYEQLRADFLRTIEYDENVDYTITLYPEEYVKTVFRFTMNQVLLSLIPLKFYF